MRSDEGHADFTDFHRFFLTYAVGGILIIPMK